MNGTVCFYGVEDYGNFYINHCISSGLDNVHITDPNSNLWWSQLQGRTIYDPNFMMWDVYDLVVITSDNKQFFEDAINRLTTVHKVPREKIKTCQEVVVLTKALKESYKFSKMFANIDKTELVTKKELSNMLDVAALNDLEKFFLLEDHRLISKWLHYFEAYDRFFSKYRGKDVTILEIGVFKGGSLQMWKNYFKTSENKVQIYGIDIDEKCKEFEEEDINIFIGSQEDRKFLRKVKKKIGKVDILVDDGGHTMKQQRVTFEELFDCVADDGIYLCEDLHTSYWEQFGGGYKNRKSFIEHSKNLIDYINANYSETDKLKRNTYTDAIRFITYCDSMIFIEKKPMPNRYTVWI